MNGHIRGGNSWRSTIGGAAILVVAGCAVGDSGEEFHNLSLGGDDAVETGDAPSSTTGADPSGSGDNATKGPLSSTTGTDDGANADTQGWPADESSDGTTAGEPMGGSTTTGPAEPPTETGEPPPPPLEPMYTPCVADSECADGICLTVYDEYNQFLGKYCTAACASPQLDCEQPVGATANPICLATEQGGSVCALSCAAGQSCPAGLSCWEQAYCF
jgi:hypothetical protein